MRRCFLVYTSVNAPSWHVKWQDSIICCELCSSYSDFTLRCQLVYWLEIDNGPACRVIGWIQHISYPYSRTNSNGFKGGEDNDLAQILVKLLYFIYNSGQSPPSTQLAAPLHIHSMGDCHPMPLFTLHYFARSMQVRPLLCTGFNLCMVPACPYHNCWSAGLIFW